MATMPGQLPDTPKPTQTDTVAQATDPDKLLDTLQKDFNRLKAQKIRKTGGIEGRVLLNLGFLYGEQYLKYKNQGLYAEPQEENKLYLQFNLIAHRAAKLLGRLASVAPVFKANPSRRDAKAMEMSEVVDRLIKATDQNVHQDSRTWEIIWWMMVGGTAFEYVPWVPNVTMEPAPQYSDQGELLWRNTVDGTIVPESQKDLAVQHLGQPPEQWEVYEDLESVGDVGSEVLGPLNVFIDQSVRSIEDLAPDQMVHIAKIKTVGWVKDNFGIDVQPQKEFKIVSTQFFQQGDATGGVFLKDLIPLVQGSAGADDPGMAVVIETFCPISKENPHGKYICWIPNDQILHVDDNPYEEIPIVDFHWRPVTTSFWTGDYITDLIPPQRFINKRMSQMGEQANASLYSTLLLADGLKAVDVPADFPGVMENALTTDGTPKVQRTAPPELPTWFLTSIDTALRMFNDVAGGADLFQESKFPGQLRGPMAVPMLQEILDTEWGPTYTHIGERMALVKQMRLNRVRQFYPPIRTMHYTDRTQKDEVLIFNTDKVLRGGLSFNVTVERGSLVPELRALREARVSERLSGPLSILYLDERSGKIDKSKIAADLAFGDEGRESREAQYRKLGAEIVDKLWRGEAIPPVLPFYDHSVMMDELESAMATTEFLSSSPQIQQGFTQRWEGHRQFLVQQAQDQQNMMQSRLIQGAVAQSTQQAAAMAASEAVHSARQAIDSAANVPTRELVLSAEQQANNGAPPQSNRPPAPAPFRARFGG